MTIDSFPDHAPSPFYSATADVLEIGGEPVTKLAERIGRTPFYVYDRSVISRQIAALRGAFPAEVELHFAVKANPMPELVKYIAPLVDGLDVASAGELATALGAEPRGGRISFAGPGKTMTELAQAITAGIVINLESARELRDVAELAAARGVRPTVAVRVNPDFELKSSGMKMAGGPKQFGVDAEAVPQLLRQMASLPVEFVGFHIFCGSQNLRPSAIVESQQKAVELAIQLAEHAPTPVRLLNVGGGLGIPYFPGEQRIDLRLIGEELGSRVARVHGALPGAKLVLEMGRYLVGEAGIYVCRVIERKVSRGNVFLVTDGGLHHHLAASGNFGQVLRKNYPVLVANRVRGTSREVCSVVGPLCTPLDLLADRMEMARAEEGDLVAVFMSGAYGLTASPLGFLSHPPPAEVIV